MLLKPNDTNYTTLQLRTTSKIMVTFSIVKASNFTPNTLFIPSPQSITLEEFHEFPQSLHTNHRLSSQITQFLPSTSLPIHYSHHSILWHKNLSYWKHCYKTNKCRTTTSWQNITVQIMTNITVQLCKQLQWNTRGVTMQKLAMTGP